MRFHTSEIDDGVRIGHGNDEMDMIPPHAAALPNLPPRFLAPAGLRWGMFRATDGTALRWAHLPDADAHLGCVLVGGFAEFAEKYFETMADLHARGVDVWFLDWRGQGGSQRDAHDGARPLARDFVRDAADLAEFTNAMLPAPARRIVVAHSMGAAIAVLALAGQPDLFAAAVLSAPMLRIATGNIPYAVARLIARAGVTFGFAATFAPGCGRWQEDPQIAANSVCSHDPLRAGLEQAWFLAQPRLRLDGPTYGWVDSAIKLSARLMRPETLRHVDTPVLIGCPGDDAFVDPTAEERAAQILPACTLVHFDTARHELFCETDLIRNAWFTAIDDFLAAHIAADRIRTAS